MTVIPAEAAAASWLVTLSRRARSDVQYVARLLGVSSSVLGVLAVASLTQNLGRAQGGAQNIEGFRVQLYVRTVGTDRYYNYKLTGEGGTKWIAGGPFETVGLTRLIRARLFDSGPLVP